VEQAAYLVHPSESEVVADLFILPVVGGLVLAGTVLEHLVVREGVVAARVVAVALAYIQVPMCLTVPQEQVGVVHLGYLV
jgi:hypothetical protein